MIQLQENENDERGLNVMLLPPQLFNHYWPELEQLLEHSARAVERGPHEAEYS